MGDKEKKLEKALANLNKGYMCFVEQDHAVLSIVHCDGDLIYNSIRALCTNYDTAKEIIEEALRDASEQEESERKNLILN